MNQKSWMNLPCIQLRWREITPEKPLYFYKKVYQFVTVPACNRRVSEA